jgi:tetratricopeptide (TPR) repeat protein
VLRAAVPGVMRAEFARVREGSPEQLYVHDLMIRAQSLLAGRDVVQVRQALEAAQEAMLCDPGATWPPAVAAYCQCMQVLIHDTPDPMASRLEARRLLERAVVLEDGEFNTVSMIGAVCNSLFLPERSDAASVRALAMNPTSDVAWEQRGWHRLMFGGDPDATLKDFRRSLMLQNGERSRVNRYYGIGIALSQLAKRPGQVGRLQDAVLWTQAGLAENPNAVVLHRRMAYYFATMGEKSWARRSVETLRRAHPDLTVSGLMASYPPESKPYIVADTLQILGEYGLPH